MSSLLGGCRHDLDDMINVPFVAEGAFKLQRHINSNQHTSVDCITLSIVPTAGVTEPTLRKSLLSISPFFARPNTSQPLLLNCTDDILSLADVRKARPPRRRG